MTEKFSGTAGAMAALHAQIAIKDTHKNNKSGARNTIAAMRAELGMGDNNVEAVDVSHIEMIVDEIGENTPLEMSENSKILDNGIIVL